MAPYLQTGSLPNNDILGLFLDEVDALQHVSDVINAALLDAQCLGCLIQVDDAIPRRLNELREFLRQQPQ